jgi:hypothetical protein
MVMTVKNANQMEAVTSHVWIFSDFIVLLPMAKNTKNLLAPQALKGIQSRKHYTSPSKPWNMSAVAGAYLSRLCSWGDEVSAFLDKSLISHL